MDRPFVSVIIPAYNAAGFIGENLKALFEQSYPRDRYEVIVVDNGSVDGTGQAAGSCGAKVVEELEAQGPDPARNTGVNHAGGEIIAFIDSDCRAERQWLEEGVAAMQENGAELAGGNIIFELSEKPSAGEYFEISNTVLIEESIRTRRVATGGNLFVSRKVFEAGINFVRQLPSSGDTYFTASATGAGFRIVYASKAVVHHPTHDTRGLLRKALRTGAGKITVWKLAMSTKTMNKSMVGQRGFSRLNPADLKRRLSARGCEVRGGMLWKVYFFSLLWLGVFCVGMVLGLLRSPDSKDVMKTKTRKRKWRYPW